MAQSLRDEAESITAIAVGRPDEEARRLLGEAAKRLTKARAYEKLAS